MSGNDDAMTPAGSGVKLTYEDFLLFPDDGKRHELIDGEHYVTPAPNLRHQRISGNLFSLINSWLDELREGFAETLRLRAAADDPDRLREIDALRDRLH